MGTQAGHCRRTTRFSFELVPQRSLVEADLIVLGNGAALTAQELEQVLAAADPGGYQVEAIPNDAVFAAIAVRRSLLEATWMEDLVQAVRAVLEPVMDPGLLWCGSVRLRLEGEAVVDSTGPQGE